MSVLLAVDPVDLYPAGADDPLGWTQPDLPSLAWTGTGNLQLSPGVSDPRAETGGGHGPFNPARVESGTLYLPPDAPLADGMTAVVRGVRWALSQTRQVIDPTGGLLDCWAATATRDTVIEADSG